MATIAPKMVVSTVLLGVMLQVPKLTGAMGGKRGATHKPCKNQGTWFLDAAVCLWVEYGKGLYHAHAFNQLKE